MFTTIYPTPSTYSRSVSRQERSPVLQTIASRRSGGHPQVLFALQQVHLEGVAILALRGLPLGSSPGSALGGRPERGDRRFAHGRRSEQMPKEISEMVAVLMGRRGPHHPSGSWQGVRLSCRGPCAKGLWIDRRLAQPIRFQSTASRKGEAREPHAHRQRRRQLRQETPPPVAGAEPQGGDIRARWAWWKPACGHHAC